MWYLSSFFFKSDSDRWGLECGDVRWNPRLWGCWQYWGHCVSLLCVSLHMWQLYPFQICLWVSWPLIHAAYEPCPGPNIFRPSTTLSWRQSHTWMDPATLSSPPLSSHTVSLAEWLRHRPWEWMTRGWIPACVGTNDNNGNDNSDIKVMMIITLATTTAMKIVVKMIIIVTVVNTITCWLDVLLFFCLPILSSHSV